MAQPVMAPTPSDLHRKFEEAFNTGNVEALVALYEPDGILVPSPGQPVRGASAIRTAYTQFLAGKPSMSIETTAVFENGDIALTQCRWTMHATDPNGAPMEMAGLAAEISRRQSDGQWRFVIDNPFAG